MANVSSSITGAATLVNSGSIEAAIDVLNNAFMDGENVYSAGITSEMAYFNYEAGDKVEMYMKLSHHRDEDKGLMENRNFSETTAVKVADIGYKRVDLMAELLPLSKTSDPRRMFLDETVEAADYAIRLPTRRLAKRILAGFTATCIFDNIAFFHATDHLCNPLEKGTPRKFGNYFTGIKVTEDGWAAFIDKVVQIEGANGYLMNADFMSARPIIAVPTAALWKKWAKIFDPEGRIAVEPTAGVTAASETTIFKNGARLTLIPELAVLTTAATLKRSYIFNPRYRRRRPFVVRIPTMPTWKRGTGAGNPFEATNDAYPVWASMEYADDYGLPHLCFCVEEP